MPKKLKMVVNEPTNDQQLLVRKKNFKASSFWEIIYSYNESSGIKILIRSLSTIFYSKGFQGNTKKYFIIGNVFYLYSETIFIII